MSAYVVDASVAAKWYFPEKWRKEARNYVSPTVYLLAPDFLQIEFANILFKKEKHREIDATQAHTFLQHFLSKTTIEYYSTNELIIRAHHLAREIGHPVYDCLYLALAEQAVSIVVTADKKFHDRVKSSQYAGFITWIEIPPQND